MVVLRLTPVVQLTHWSKRGMDVPMLVNTSLLSVNTVTGLPMEVALCAVPLSSTGYPSGDWGMPPKGYCWAVEWNTCQPHARTTRRPVLPYLTR